MINPASSSVGISASSGWIFVDTPPERFRVQRSLDGGWYVIDTDPGTYSRIEHTHMMIKDIHVLHYSNRGTPWRQYGGAQKFAMKHNNLCRTNVPNS